MQNRRNRKTRARRKRAAPLLAFAASALAARLASAGPANWLNAVDGNWTDPQKWSTNPNYPSNGIPGSGDSYEVTIGATGAAYTVTLNAQVVPSGLITVNSLNLNSSNATLVDTGGTFIALNGFQIAAGQFRLNGGTIKDTTIFGADNSFLPSIGTLDHVTLALPVTVSNGGIVQVQSGLTLNGSPISLASGSIQFISGGLAGTGDIVLDGLNSANSVNLSSIPSGITIRTGAAGGSIGAATNVTLFNSGVISSQTPGQTIKLIGSSTVNQGTLEAKNGGTMVVPTLQNSGTVRVSTGSSLVLAGSWSSTGPIQLNDSTLTLGGTFSNASIQSIVRSGGIVNFTGVLDNSNSTLVLDNQTGTWTTQGGTINGGTVRAVSPARLYIPPGKNITLNGVLLDSDLSIADAQIKIANGLSLSGHQIFGNGTLSFTGTTVQSLQNGRVTFFDGSNNTVENTSSVVSRIGADFLVQGQVFSISGGNSGIINQGTVCALGPGGKLAISNVLNQGTLDLQAMSTLGTALSPSNSARIVLNSGLVQFSGPGVQVFGSLDNTATGRVLVATGADATFNGPVTGVSGTELRVEAGASAFLGTAVTGPLTLTGPGSMTFGNGASSIGALSVASATVQSQAVVQLDSFQVTGLTISGEVDLRATPSGSSVNSVNTLDLLSDGVLNLANNALIVNYDGADSSPLPDIRSKIISKHLVANGPIGSVDAGRLAAGYAEASRILGPGGGTFMGQNVDGSAVLVRYTLMGDANLDGAVNFSDLVVVAQNYGTQGMSWIDGDSNGDGLVDFQDLVKVAQSYSGSLAAPIPGATPQFNSDWITAASSVPEPSAFLFFLFSALQPQRHRRRVAGATARNSEGGSNV